MTQNVFLSGVLLLLSLSAWAQPAVEGSFTVRKFRCIPDSVRKAIDAADHTWPGQDIAAVSGTLWSSDGIERITVARATILIYKADSLLAYTNTDAEGRYTIYLPVGNYRLETCRNGYKSATAEVQPQRKLPFTYDVDLETVLVREIPATRTDSADTDGSFSSRISSGTPLAPARLHGTIELINNKFPLQEVEVQLYRGDEFITATNCDDGGLFKFNGLEDGKYDVIILTDRDDNSPIPDVQVLKGKIRTLDIRLKRSGKLARPR